MNWPPYGIPPARRMACESNCTSVGFSGPQICRWLLAISSPSGLPGQDCRRPSPPRRFQFPRAARKSSACCAARSVVLPRAGWMGPAPALNGAPAGPGGPGHHRSARPPHPGPATRSPGPTAAPRTPLGRRPAVFPAKNWNQPGLDQGPHGLGPSQPSRPCCGGALHSAYVAQPGPRSRASTARPLARRRGPARAAASTRGA